MIKNKNHIKSFFISLGIVFSLLFILTSLRTPESDGIIRFSTFKSFFTDDFEYSKFSTIQPFITKVFDFITRIFYPSLAIDFYPVHIELILILILILISFQINHIERFKLFLILILLPLSMLAHYSGQYFSEWTSSLLIVLGWLIFKSNKNTTFITFGALISALGVANWPVLMAGILGVALVVCYEYLILKKKDYRFICFLINLIAISASLILIELLIKNGLHNNPYLSSQEKGFTTFMPYSGLPSFSYPIVLGLTGNLFALGKSIFLFNPFLIYIFIADYKYKVHMIIMLIITLLIYSKWWAWYGGYSFGTRFYIFAVIPSIYAYLNYIEKEGIIRKILGLFVLFFSMWVAICGKHFGMEGLSNVCASNNYALESVCWYIPEFSPLIYPIINNDLIQIFTNISYLDYIYLLLVTFIIVAINFPKKIRDSIV
jgi:hypothetical protein